jgi:hypothetical protein
VIYIVSISIPSPTIKAYRGITELLHPLFTLAVEQEFGQLHDPAGLLPPTGRPLPIDQEVVLQGQSGRIREEKNSLLVSRLYKKYTHCSSNTSSHCISLFNRNTFQKEILLVTRHLTDPYRPSANALQSFAPRMAKIARSNYIQYLILIIIQ